jgi:hypothetical protein
MIQNIISKAERDKAVAERDSAIEAKDAAIAECDRAIKESHEAIAARDRAFTECNAAKAECDLANSTVAELRDAMLSLQNQVKDGVDKCRHLIQEKATNQSSFKAMHVRQIELSNKLVLIQKIARLLSPEADKKRQLA